MNKNQEKIYTKRDHYDDPKHIIAQMDGAMVPIVTINQEFDGDKRTTRERGWNEGRLTLAHELGSRSPIYKATMGTIDEVGKQLEDVVALAGRGNETHIHCVGDGAPWIAAQVEEVFGGNASFLIDFFHLGKYIADAAQCIAPNDPNGWRREQQELLKNNQLEDVMKTLKDHIDSEGPDHDCGAHACYSYMEKRTRQFDYKGAIEKELPIGSGEIESGHRIVTQKRLKISGAAWLTEIAGDMLAMCAIIASDCWENYWKMETPVEVIAY